MRFVRDPEKNDSNIRKRGLDFEDAARMFDGPMPTFPDNRRDYGDEGWVGIGALDDIIITVVYTEAGDDVTRLISARKAVKHEQDAFFESISH